MAGIRCKLKNKPNDSIPNINGDKNPHTGHVARINNKNVITPVHVIIGIIDGQ